MADKLTIEEVEGWILECETVGIEQDVAQQLADAMHENETLRRALEHYKAADDGVYQMMAGFKATSDMEDPNSIAGRALRSCQGSTAL